MDLVAYEFYVYSKGNKTLIGILPEKRKDPKRITQKSILRWGRMLVYDTADRRSLFYERVAINQYTGKFFRFVPSLKTHCDWGEVLGNNDL
jgi:hypothetical protein